MTARRRGADVTARRRGADVTARRRGGGPVTVLLAPDKFKGSLPAADVAAHLGAGLRRHGVGVEELPVADGGEGTVAAALAAGFAPVELEATGPLGQPVHTRYARRGETAVIEMAAVSGLQMVSPTPETARRATSRGVGELIAHALDGGAGRVVVGVGGSASTDGGAGLLAALGARLLGPGEAAVPDGGAALARIARVDLTGLHPGLRRIDLVLAADVDNPLLGPTGAAAVFGPQKGADAAAVAELDAALGRWVRALEAAGRADAVALAEAPGAGAAGGVGYALLVLGAVRRPGVDVVLELAGFQERLAGVDAVVTGEGSLDEQTLGGKAPVGVAAAAARAGVPTVAVCGRSTLSGERAAGAGFAAGHALTDIEPDPARCMAEAGPLLERLAERVAASLRAAAATRSATAAPGGR